MMLTTCSPGVSGRNHGRARKKPWNKNCRKVNFLSGSDPAVNEQVP